MWFLRNGNHLCHGLWGTGSTEYGHKTWWVHIGIGVLVWESKDVRYPDEVDVCWSCAYMYKLYGRQSFKYIPEDGCWDGHLDDME